MIFKVQRRNAQGRRLRQTYEGFRKFRFSHGRRIPAAIAVVTVEDMEDVWEVDPDKLEIAAEELRRYYRSEHGVEDTDVVIYSQAHLFLADEDEDCQCPDNRCSRHPLAYDENHPEEDQG